MQVLFCVRLWPGGYGRVRTSAGIERNGPVAPDGVATLASMHDDYIASGTKGHRDDAPDRSGGAAPETVRSEPHAGSETVAEQRVPAAVDPDLEQRVLAGPLSRLFLKISTAPNEAFEALDGLSAMIGERVLREIRAFRREFETRMGAMEKGLETRLGAMETSFNAWRDAQDAKIDALHKMYDGLHKQMRLVVAVLALQFVFLGALAMIG